MSNLIIPQFGLLSQYSPANEIGVVYYNDPTKPFAINGVKNPTFPLAVSVANDLSTPAYDFIQPTAINQSTFNGTHVTYAINDFDIGDAAVSALLGTTKGTIEGWIRPVSGTPANTGMIWSIANTTASNYLYVGLEATTGKLVCVLVSVGVVRWRIASNSQFAASNVGAHFRLIHDGISPVIQINNNTVASTLTGSFPTEWINNLTGLDNSRIGSLNRNSLGDQFLLNGDRQSIFVSNEIYTEAENTRRYLHNQPTW